MLNWQPVRASERELTIDEPKRNLCALGVAKTAPQPDAAPSGN